MWHAWKIMEDFVAVFYQIFYLYFFFECKTKIVYFSVTIFLFISDICFKSYCSVSILFTEGFYYFRLRVIFLRFLKFARKVGKKFFDLLFWVWGVKEQLMASKLPKWKKFLVTPGAQGSHPNRSIPGTLQIHFCS